MAIRKMVLIGRPKLPASKRATIRTPRIPPALSAWLDEQILAEELTPAEYHRRLLADPLTDDELTVELASEERMTLRCIAMTADEVARHSADAKRLQIRLSTYLRRRLMAAAIRRGFSIPTPEQA